MLSNVRVLLYMFGVRTCQKDLEIGCIVISYYKFSYIHSLHQQTSTHGSCLFDIVVLVFFAICYNYATYIYCHTLLTPPPPSQTNMNSEYIHHRAYIIHAYLLSHSEQKLVLYRPTLYDCLVTFSMLSSHLIKLKLYISRYLL